VKSDETVETDEIDEANLSPVLAILCCCCCDLDNKRGGDGDMFRVSISEPLPF